VGVAKKLILDVDTGTDDAVALMLAALHPDLELVAATTVNGNNPVVYCTDNTLRVFDLLGLATPVYEGMAAPMVRDDFPVPQDPADRRWDLHGRELPIPKPGSVKQAQQAVEFLVETYMAATEPIALVPVGPLTNIAMAIKLEPRIVDRIPETIIMGGGHEVGNMSPAAEFNVWADPDAARVVFRAGLRNVAVMPLDATHRALVSLDDCRRMRELGTPAGEAAAAFIDRRIRGYDEFQPMDVTNSAPVHDALCIAYLVDPTVVTGRRLHVDVETHGELTVGRTVMDTHERTGKAPNAYVAFDADAPKFVAMLLDTFARR
jgi:inosine-uridine nucleoside N-ribohydrolase